MDAAAITELRGQLAGEAFTPADAGYEGARRVWNGNIDRRPALIARCANAVDVRHAVRFAAAHKPLLSVRGGGHSAPGYGVNDGGMVIDLNGMKAISVDAVARTAVAEGGVLLYPLDQGREVLRFYRDLCPTLPDAAEVNAALLTGPGGAPVVALLLGYNGPVAEGEALLAPVRAFGRPLADLVRPMTYGERQVLLDEPNATHGLHRYWRSAFTEQLTDAFIDELIDAAGRFSSPMSAMLMFYNHGAITRVAPEETAFSARTAQWDFDAIGVWTDAAESAGHIGWVRDFWARAEPHLKGSVYVNHIADDDRPEKVRASYGANHARLRRIKATYDPANLFHMNANILPD